VIAPKRVSGGHGPSAGRCCWRRARGLRSLTLSVGLALLAWCRAGIVVAQPTAQVGPRRVDLILRLEGRAAADLEARTGALLDSLSLEVNELSSAASCARARTGSTLACVTIDQPTPSALRVEIVDPERADSVSRTFSVGPAGPDAVSFEELSQILETSLNTLLAGQRLDGAAATSVSAPVAPAPSHEPERASRTALPSLVPRAPASTPQPKPTAGAASPVLANTEAAAKTRTITAATQRSASASAGARGVSATTPALRDLALDAGYELAHWASSLWIGGPRVGMLWLPSSTKLRAGGALLLWSGVPVSAAAARADATVRLWPSLARVMGVVEWRPTPSVSLGPSLGVALEVLRIAASVSDARLQPIASFTRANLGLRVAFALRWQFASRLSIALEPALDVQPLQLRLGVTRGQEFERVLVLNSLRMAAGLWLAFEL